MTPTEGLLAAHRIVVVPTLLGYMWPTCSAGDWCGTLCAHHSELMSEHREHVLDVIGDATPDLTSGEQT